MCIIMSIEANMIIRKNPCTGALLSMRLLKPLERHQLAPDL